MYFQGCLLTNSFARLIGYSTSSWYLIDLSDCASETREQNISKVCQDATWENPWQILDNWIFLYVVKQILLLYSTSRYSGLTGHANSTTVKITKLTAKCIF